MFFFWFFCFFFAIFIYITCCIHALNLLWVCVCIRFIFIESVEVIIWMSQWFMLIFPFDLQLMQFRVLIYVLNAKILDLLFCKISFELFFSLPLSFSLSLEQWAWMPNWICCFEMQVASNKSNWSRSQKSKTM